MRKSLFSLESDAQIRRHVYAIVLAVAIITLGFRLGASVMSSHDEARCCETALNMIHTGDYLVPVYENEIRIQKPPLVYWFIAGCVNVFGENNLAYRLPGALMAILTILLTVKMAASLAGEEAGMASGLILATNYEFVKDGRYATYDMPLAFFVCVSAFCFLQWLLGKRSWWVYGAFASLGFAFLTKGPIGLVFPLLAALVFAIVMIARGEYAGPRGWRLLHLVPALVLWAAIALPWFYFILQNVPNAMSIWTGELDRGGEDATHPKPFWFYSVSVLSDVLPWTLLLLCALYFLARHREWTQNQGFIFVLCWLLGGFIFLHFWTSKRGTYLLPLYPAGAILAGVYLARLFERQPLITSWEKWAFRITVLLITLLALAAPWIPLIFKKYYVGGWTLPVSMFLALGACAWLAWDALRRFNYRGAFFAIVLAALFALSIWNGFLLPMKAAEDIRSESRESHAITLYRHPRV